MTINELRAAAYAAADAHQADMANDPAYAKEAAALHSFANLALGVEFSWKADGKRYVKTGPTTYRPIKPAQEVKNTKLRVYVEGEWS
jgi:hypothetical protein